MKQLNDGTRVRAIMWYLALEYKDHLLQNGENVGSLLELNKEQFIDFCQLATSYFLKELCD